MLAMGPRDLNSALYSPVHCSSHSMTSFQSSELTELPVVENSQLFAQRVHSARYAPLVLVPQNAAAFVHWRVPRMCAAPPSLQRRCHGVPDPRLAGARPLKPCGHTFVPPPPPASPLLQGPPRGAGCVQCMFYHPSCGAVPACGLPSSPGVAAAVFFRILAEGCSHSVAYRCSVLQGGP